MYDDRRLPVMVKNHMAWHVPHLQGIHRHLNVFTHDQWSKAPTDSLIICNPDELTDSDIQTQRATGKSIVVDNLWDGHTDIKDFSQANLVLSFDCFFWIHEHGFHRFANLDQITLQPSYHKRAFMPMRHARHFRERVLEIFAPLLSEMIWSYENHQLPNDIENRSDRYFNRSWYDDTCMSIVVETVMDTVLPFPFITEKTWKPIIFGHPFLIIGCAGTLAWLRDHGFETFDNMFDESYDQIPDWQERVRLVKHNASTAIGNPWDAETWRRIRHNQRVFFDDDIVQSMIKQNLIDPLANQYANAS